MVVGLLGEPWKFLDDQRLTLFVGIVRACEAGVRLALVRFPTD